MEVAQSFGFILEQSLKFKFRPINNQKILLQISLQFTMLLRDHEDDRKQKDEDEVRS
jgi:hypothetical protein